MAFNKRLGNFFQKTTSRPSKEEEIVYTDRFQEAVKRLEESDYYEIGSPYGFFDGRHIIGANTPIHEGVYVGALPHEAIVVDEAHGELEKVYTDLLVLHAKDHGKKNKIEKTIFPYVSRIVQEKLQFSPESVRTALDQNIIQPDHKVSLDYFLIQGVGIARHQMLLAAYLIEKLKLRGYLSGVLTIDSKYSFQEQTPESLTYKGEDGNEFHFDPIQLREDEKMMLVA